MAAGSGRSASSRRRTGSAFLTLGLSVCILSPPVTAGVSGPSVRPVVPFAPVETVETQDDEAVAFARGVLLDAGTADALRRTAVERLARNGTPAAIEALGAALRTGDPAIVGITLQVLGQAPDADEQLLEPLIPAMLEALAVAPTGLLDPLGLLLARVDKADRAPVREMAMDPQRPPTERLAAIHVLGVLATIESGDALIDLIDPAQTEDPAIRRAAREALARMIGRDLGADHSAWTDWWSQARRRGLADWWREIRRRDREQIARLQSDIDALASRHVELLRQLYAGFNEAAPSPREIELLTAHLGDPAAAVRRFAIERVERLVRDSLSIPDPLLAPITARLDDENGAIRAAAVRLLDEAAVPDLAEWLIARLPSEPDPVTASAMLDVLGRGEVAEAAEAIVARLDVPATAPAAARALWLLARGQVLPDPVRERAATLAARRVERVPEAADAARLLATIGDEATVSELAARLLPETPAILSIAIAEGLSARGRLDLLLERAAVASIRPVLVETLAEGDPTEPMLGHLLDLEPPAEAEDRRAWESAVARLARRLPPFGVLNVDAALVETGGAGVVDRRRLMLVPTAELAASENREDAPDVLRTAVTVLLELGRASEAWSLTERSGTAGTHESLRGPRARAAMLTGRYDEAATLVDDPAAWIAVLRQACDHTDAHRDAEPRERLAESARRLATEIRRRFDGALDDGQIETVGRLLAMVTPAPTTATGAAGEPGSG